MFTDPLKGSIDVGSWMRALHSTTTSAISCIVDDSADCAMVACWMVGWSVHCHLCPCFRNGRSSLEAYLNNLRIIPVRLGSRRGHDACNNMHDYAFSILHKLGLPSPLLAPKDTHSQLHDRETGWKPSMHEWLDSSHPGHFETGSVRPGVREAEFSKRHVIVLFLCNDSDLKSFIDPIKWVLRLGGEKKFNLNKLFLTFHAHCPGLWAQSH